MTQSGTKPIVPEHGPLWARIVIAMKNIAFIGLLLSILVAFGALFFVVAASLIDLFWVLAVGEQTGVPFTYRGAAGVVSMLTFVVFSLLVVRAENVVSDARDCSGVEGQ
jgi:hypothetical protein